MLRKTAVTTPKGKKLRYRPPHTIIEDTVRHNIVQMTSTSKACIPCLLGERLNEVI